VILGCLADETGFTAAEIDAMDARTAIYWWNCIMAYRRRMAEES